MLLLLLRQLLQMEEVARPEGAIIDHDRHNAAMQLRHEGVAAKNGSHISRAALHCKGKQQLEQ